MMKLNTLIIGATALLFSACNLKQQKEYQMKYPIQNHSYSNPKDFILSQLDLNLHADFDNKVLEGYAAWNVTKAGESDTLILDVRQLLIEKVEVNGSSVSYHLGDEHDIFGQALAIPMQNGADQVKIYYKTQPESAALQWLDSLQGAGKPFLFSQSQAILARTWVPCMDLPSVRFTYTAQISVPTGLLPLMSAENPVEKNAESVYHFTMPQPIPSYLLALCIGDLEYTPLGEACGVYALPPMLAQSASEFEDLEAMIHAAENLYGPYQWGQYDVVVLPPSFPFGGMENPRITFATPSIITGDKSLVSLIAHELAHSWSGNLVTNETWQDFWLNEGFTVYFEDRIMEEVYGKEYALMMTRIGLDELKETVAEFMETRPNDTKLFLDLEGRNPDDGVTNIAYEKGRFFLLSLERLVGRERFDTFLNEYFNEFAFKTINTETFINYISANLLNTPELQEQARIHEWIFETGLPDNLPGVESQYLHTVDSLIQLVIENPRRISADLASDFNTHQFLHLLRNTPREVLIEHIDRWDEAFSFTQSQNAEIQTDWYSICIEAHYKPAREPLAQFLQKVGRRKFVAPLFKALLQNPEWHEFATVVYEHALPGYHAVTANTITQMMQSNGLVSQ